MKVYLYFALGVFLMASFDVCSPNKGGVFLSASLRRKFLTSTTSSYATADNKTLQVASSTPTPSARVPFLRIYKSPYTTASSKPQLRPKPLIIYQLSSYVTAPNLHECVPCHADDQARKDFDSCLINLSRQLKEAIRSCCENEFGINNCKNMTSGGTDYDAICRNPDKGLQVERCFWYEARTNAVDITSYVACKEGIYDKYCVAGSSSSKMTGVMSWMIAVLLIWLY